jgi:large subunit ribosomal protein L10
MIKACRLGYVIEKADRADALAVKDVICDASKLLLKDAEVVVAIPVMGLTVDQRDALKDLLPEAVLAKVVKNKMLVRASRDFPQFAGIEQFAKGSNMYMFLDFEDLKETVVAVEKWRKESGVDKEVYDLLGGAFDGEYLDKAGVEATSKLPTKRDLMAKFAGQLKQVPTRVAKGIKEVPAGLARGVKQLDAERLARVIKAIVDKED